MEDRGVDKESNLEPQQDAKSSDSPASRSRRKFLGNVGGLTAVTMATGAVGLPPLLGSKNAEAQAQFIAVGPADARRLIVFQIRQTAATRNRNVPVAAHPTNGDEILFPNRIGSYSKALPHNGLGEADLNAFNALVKAVNTSKATDFEAVPLGGAAKLANPLAAFTFDLEGADSHRLGMVPPPAFSSEVEGAEMNEVYWQALTRDVPFSQYGAEPLTAAAIADMSQFSIFAAVNAGNLFRGETPGDLTGPYLSQFLWKDVPYGLSTIVQKYANTVPGNDLMTAYAEWLNIQRGIAPAGANIVDPTPRFIRDGRGLADYVHVDFPYQAYLNAALILLSFGGAALDDANPYKASVKQGAFITFGGPHILELVAKASLAAFKAAWYQKWVVHRRLRPEVFAGRIHNHITGAATYPIHPSILNSQAVADVFTANGTYLLPMAYPEGSPTHPAYPAGHATIAGACVTVLKAFFKESFVIPTPVVAADDGLTLLPFVGPNLTVGGELNKLAANISLGRDTAGVHWRSDGIEGMNLGEDVAIALLRDRRDDFTESFNGFSLTRFDGTTIII